MDDRFWQTDKFSDFDSKAIWTVSLCEFVQKDNFVVLLKRGHVIKLYLRVVLELIDENMVVSGKESSAPRI